MNNLYAPWRTTYIRKSDEKNDTMPASGCTFCTILASPHDAENFVIKRFNHTTVLLNLYPYNAGHILVIPNTHVSTITMMDPEQQAEYIALIGISCDILRINIKANGVNVGINLGTAAGAGIPSHLHTHCIPRWEGDTNFMPVIAQTKVISVNMNAIYTDLRKYFDTVTL